ITQRWSDSWGFSWPGSTEEDKKVDFVRLGSDADFVKTMGIKLVEGRDIDVYNYPTDTSAVMLNETAVKAMRLKSPLGTVIKTGSPTGAHVVGVVKDFIMESPFEKSVSPMMILGPDVYYSVLHM